MAFQQVSTDEVRKEVKTGLGRMGVKLSWEGREKRLRDLSYADGLVLCRELEEGLKVTVGRFIDVYQRRDPEFDAEKTKVERSVGSKWKVRVKMCWF